MKPQSVLLFLLCFLIAGCFGGSDQILHWKDGNYRVYTRSHSREIIIGYYMGDGAILGLSGSTVTAAGSSLSYVTFKRETGGRNTEFYYIEKEPAGEGKIYGPFEEEEYAKVASSKNLPPYSWHLKKWRFAESSGQNEPV